MGTWATASLFLASICWIEAEANPQLFQNQLPYHSYNPFLYQAKRREYSGTSGEVEAPQAQPYSASGLHPHNRLSSSFIDFFPTRNPRYDNTDAFTAYSNFEKVFLQNLENYQNNHQAETQTSASHETSGHYSEDQATDGTAEHQDHVPSQTMVYMAPPEDLQGGEAQRYQRTLPDYEDSEDHQGHHDHHDHHDHHESHGEVHYHKHEHEHEHKHKQEHVHKHKQEHEHSHLHNQKHNHEHHSEHKHGHHQEHQHHQEHKHEHHNSHDHKHSHHQEHKHGHHHDHEHKHKHLNKHQHHHGHKHMSKHGHKHIHHSKHH